MECATSTCSSPRRARPSRSGGGAAIAALALVLAAGCHRRLAAPQALEQAVVSQAAEEVGAPSPPTPEVEWPDAGEESDAGPVPDAGPGPPQWPSPAQLLVEATVPADYLEDEVAGGAHIRFGTQRGPVHVWRPAGYLAATAGTVIYLHGYFNSVDSAWDEHRLGDQFAACAQNALFIVPEVPSARADDVFWKDLGELLREVRVRTKVKIPAGPIIVLGHSGAYRTLESWLDEPRLTEIILLDALYGYDDEFATWLVSARRRVVLVAVDTSDRSQAFLRRFPKAVRLEELPDSLDLLTPEQRSARLVYMPTTRFDHMGLVTQGQVVPLVLGLSALKKL